MLKEYLKVITLFLKSSNLYRGIVQTTAVILPLITFYLFSDVSYAIPIAIGVFLNAPSNIPGTLKRKTLTTLVSIILTMLVTILVCFSRIHFALLIITLGILSFFISLISAYGFRGSLIAFSGLLAIVLSLANKVSGADIWMHTALIGIGGLWFLVVVFISHWIAPKKDEDQLISETLYLTGKYLKIRGKLLLKKTQRDKLLVEILKIQTQLNEKHEVLRELLLSERTKTGRSHFDEKRVLIFIALIDILELALANTLDYTKIDTIVNDRNLLKEFKKLNLTMGKHLQVLSEKLINKKEVQSKTELLDGLANVEKSIEKYKKSTDISQRREAIIILRNLLDYQAQQIAKVRSIRRVMNNVNGTKKVKLKSNEAAQFITPEEYNLQILAEHFTINSPIFRHALRLSITVLFGFLFGTIVGVKNPYWIVLTLIVLMRPSYGLTKERSINRIIGTLIGAAFATLVILITSNTIVYMVLATLSLTIALGLLQQSYRSAAAFITINVIFIYTLIEPNNLAVIQFRVIDTAIGALLAVLANYLIWPTWEFMNLNPIIIETIKKNKAYLLAIKEIYHTKQINNLSYKVPRKEAFLAISNLNAAFQRMTQDPKSKQKEMRLIYEMVTLNNTFVSALASMGSFIQSHETTSSSKNFDAFIMHIENQLENTEAQLNKEKTAIIKEHLNIDTAQKALKYSYTKLSKIRDKEIKEGKTVIDKKMRLHLQEAHLIQTQLNWLKVLSEDINRTTKRYTEMFVTK